MNKSELEDGRWNLNEDDVMQEHFKAKHEKKELEDVKERLNRCEYILKQVPLSNDLTDKLVFLQMIQEYFQTKTITVL